MSQQLITLITGANQGLGYHAAQQLASTGKHLVIMGSRSLEKGKAAKQQILSTNPTIESASLHVLRIDIADDTSIAAAVETVKSNRGHIDILINNAAISGYPSLNGETSREKYQVLYNTNVTGTAAVTESFLPLLRASKAPSPGRRIVMVSSRLGSMQYISTMGAGSFQFIQYGITKAALNNLGVSYSGLLKEEGIAVVLVCPGHCATNLNDYGGAKPPEDGAKEIVNAATEGGMELSGKFITEGKILPW